MRVILHRQLDCILRNDSFVIEKYVETTVSQYIFGMSWGISDWLIVGKSI